MKRSADSLLFLPLAVALAATLTGCGGGNPFTPTSPSPAPLCSQTVVFTGQGSIPTMVVSVTPFTTSATDRLDVIVDWTFADSPIGVYVVPKGTCDLAGFNARSCTFLIQSEPGTKPRKVSAPNVPPANYDLLIANFASRQESVSTQVISSSSTCPAVARDGGAGATTAGPWVIEGIVHH